MKVLNKILVKIMSSRIYRRFAFKWLAYFTFRIFGWPKFPKSRYFKIRQIAESKYHNCGILAFVSVDKCILNYRLNHLLTGCQWGHAGYIYWDQEGELRIKHIINRGRTDDYLLDLFGEIDGFALLWIPLKSEEDRKRVLSRVEKLDSVPVEYDYALTLDPEILDWLDSPNDLPPRPVLAYCSEYVYMLVHGLTALRTAQHYGREFFEPDDLFAGSEVLYSEVC